MTEQELRDFETWFAEAACFADCDEHDEAAFAFLIAEVRRLQARAEHDRDLTCGCGIYIHHSRWNPEALHANDCPFQTRGGLRAALGRTEQAEAERDAAIAERDSLREWSADFLARVECADFAEVRHKLAAFTEARQVLRRCDDIFAHEGWGEGGNLRKDIAAVLAEGGGQ